MPSCPALVDRPYFLGWLSRIPWNLLLIFILEVTPEIGIRHGTFYFSAGLTRQRTLVPQGWAQTEERLDLSSLVTAVNRCVRSTGGIYFADRIYDSCSMQIAETHAWLYWPWHVTYARSKCKSQSREWFRLEFVWLVAVDQEGWTKTEKC